MTFLANRCRFFLPATLLLILIASFIGIERKMEANERAFQAVLTDEVPQMAASLQNSVWAVISIVNKTDPNELTNDIKDDLARRLSEIEQHIARINDFIADHPEETLEHAKDLKSLNHLLTLSAQLRDLLVKDAPITAVAADEIRRQTGDFERTVGEFNTASNATHEKLYNRLHAAIRHHEKERFTLLILIPLCGFALLGFFICNARKIQVSLAQAGVTERTNALFISALQSVRVGVMIRDMQKPDHPVMFVNQAFSDLTGYDLDLLVAQRPDILFGWRTDTSTIDAYHRAIGAQQASTFDLLIYRRDSSSFWSEWHISPVHDKKGVLTHYVCLITDIASLRQTQEELLVAKEQAERASAVKSSFLATMSHEIRTPINGLLGVLELLGDSALNKDQRHLLDTARASGHALCDIINDILDYAKIEAGKITIAAEPFAIRPMLQEVMDLTQAGAMNKKIALSLEVDDNVPEAFASDSGRLRQVLLNLVSNAIKFTDEGKVTLRVKQLMTQTDQQKTSALIRFEVQDTGIGISTTEQGLLFQEFSQIERSFTRRYGGTGLGLAITRRLVTMMKGEIGVDSKPGQGSLFWVVLPLPLALEMPKAKETPPLANNPKNRDPANRRILLCEDNDTNRLVIGRYLQKAGYAFDEAVNGSQAVQYAREKPYDLILMDISMPEMDGLEATRRLRAMGGWAGVLPIIALTAHVMQGDRERCLAAGMNDHLIKPIDSGTLMQALERWLPEITASGASPMPPPSPPREPTEEIDRKIVDRISAELGHTTVVKIADTFLRDLTRHIETLKTQRDSPTMAAVHDTAHTLKSSSANCGLVRFSALMAALERAAANGEEDRVRELLQTVESASQSAREALEAEKARHAG